MERVRDPAHARRLGGLRFRDRETERQYRVARLRTATAFARTGYLGSTPSWTLLLVAVVALDPHAAGRAAVYVGAWIVLLLVLTALTVPASLQRTVVPLAALANCVAGLLIVWLLSEVVLTGEVAQSRAGVMTAGLVVVMFFGFAVFRIPPGLATAAVLPYLAYGGAQLSSAYDRQELNAVEAGSLAAAQGIAFLGCLLVCLVTEVVARRTFVKDLVISAQQRELHASRETLRRYVPRAVVEHIVRGDTDGIDVPVRRRVTVLFADLAGSTTLADRVEAEVLTQVVNDFMTEMTAVVDEHGGTVNEFAGDGLMALFGAPDVRDVVEQAESAVGAGLAMQARLPGLNDRWQRLGVTTPLRMRIGINTGVLSVGSFGSEGRMTYTAIGLQTNIAARLQAHCEPGGVLLSDATWHLAKDRFPCQPRGEVECRGVHYPVRVYAPVPA